MTSGKPSVAPDVRTSVVWFRRDLRLSDNPAWAAATASSDRVVALFVLDPRPLNDAGNRRRDVLISHLAALDASLRERGGALLVRSGDPTNLVPEVAVETAASEVHVNADVTLYARQRDALVKERLGSVRLASHWGGFFHAPGSIRSASSGSVHKVFTPFWKVWADTELAEWPTAGNAEVWRPTEGESLPSTDGSAEFEAGEAGAHSRLSEWLEHVDGYPDRRDSPADELGTSHLSADLRFGTISARHVAEVVGTATPGRGAFVRQLAWRDWYAHLLFERPSLARHAMKPEMDQVQWRVAPDELSAWKLGQTGYPIVDAGMRQLAATGWMHNRVRMITASFLVKDLLVDWRLGEAHFRRELVDFEITQNVGNWQWVAGTGPDASPYFRIFNPVTQSRKFDPDGEYIRRWVPELAALPNKALHAPWEVGPLELAGAGVTLGETYPEPIVDHGLARQRTLATYAAAKAQ
jgi:deoxyribodipyrimidine photo-lyase